MTLGLSSALEVVSSYSRYTTVLRCSPVRKCHRMPLGYGCPASAVQGAFNSRDRHRPSLGAETLGQETGIEAWAILRCHPHGSEVPQHSVNPCLVQSVRNAVYRREPAAQRADRPRTGIPGIRSVSAHTGWTRSGSLPCCVSTRVTDEQPDAYALSPLRCRVRQSIQPRVATTGQWGVRPATLTPVASRASRR
jgi:hypothetical protein